MGENRRDDWRGWRFVVVSLIVTGTCIIFFFAGRQIFPTIVKQGRFLGGILTRRVTEWGGVRLRLIELQLLQDQGIANSESLSVPFKSLMSQLNDELSHYQGELFWGLNLSEVKVRILEKGWVKSVFLRRAFPDTLKVQLIPRIPVFLVRSSREWAAVDEEGSVLAISDQIPGAWIHLPVVSGLEAAFDRGKNILETRRMTKEESIVLRDAYALVSQLKAKLAVDVDSLSVKQESWTKSALLSARFSLPRATQEMPAKATDLKTTVTFLSGDWSERISALQFVLSDLSQKGLDEIRVLGQYSGRWIVEDAVPTASLGPKKEIRSVQKRKVKKGRRR